MSEPKLHLSFYASQKGQVALTTVFLIGSFIILMAITLSFLSASIISSNRAAQAGSRSLLVAQAGVQDAVLRLVRDNAFEEDFTVNVNGDIATVSVVNTKDVDGRVIVISSSTVNSSQRTVEAIISIVSSTGRVSVSSMRQI